MPAVASPSPPKLTYSCQFRRCGKQDCPLCRQGASGHGPYWYAYWWEGGRTRSRYLGKNAPPEAADATGGPRRRAGSQDGRGRGREAARRATLESAPAVQPALRVRTLGAFQVWHGEVAIGEQQWSRRRAAALFKHLLVTPAHRLHREQAIELLWPEDEADAAAPNLRAVVYLLRKILDAPDAPASHVQMADDVLVLRPNPAGETPSDWLDAAAFAAAARAALKGRSMVVCRRALALYTGDFLPADVYDQWAVDQREALRGLYLDLLVHLARLCAAPEPGARADPEEAIGYLKLVLAADPCQEQAARILIRLLARTGRRVEALRAYDSLAAALRDDLGLTPSAKTQALHAELLALYGAEEPAADQSTLPMLRSPGPLPVPLTSFIGRAQELALARGLLGYGSLPGAERHPPTRLLTLTGVGGCGKTRLALELAAGLAGQFPDGVWLVELGALADATLLPQTMLSVLGLREEQRRAPQETIVATLQPLRLLLVLDNCEHLLDACAELAVAVLRACPGVQMLATSRQALGIGGETVLRLPPLSLPTLDGPQPPVEHLLEYEAVSLFVARVRAGRPGFALTTHNAPAVLQICRRLDGLPLAIELAAARVGVLAVEAIAERLDDRFRLLAGGSRTALPRQQTLRATMDWSYNLLLDAEQLLLCRLAVFAGGCTLEAAEAIAPGDGVEASEMLDLLGALAVKSLVQTSEHAGQTRYGLLETVREYARERLRAQGREGSARARHARWYGDLAEMAVTHLQGPEQREWLARLDLEHENLRAAIAWALETGAQEEGLRLAGSLAFFWSIRGRLSEGRRWLARFLALGGDAAPLVRARAARGAGMLATYQGDHAQAAAWLAESLALCRIHGDTPGIISTLQRQGDLTYRLGDYPGTEALFEEILALAREARDQRAIALALNGLGNVANERGEYTVATARYQGSLVMLRALGDERAVTVLLNNLGNVAYAQGDFARAAAVHEENVAVRRALGDNLALATTLGNLGKAWKAQGDHTRARTAHEEALALARAVGAQRTIATTLTYLSDLCLDQGELDVAATHAAEALALFGAVGDKAGILAALQCRASVIIALMDQTSGTNQDAVIWAVHLLAAVEAQRAALGIALMPPDRPGLERYLAAARALLDGETFAAAWAEGQTMSLGDAIALAHSHDQSRISTSADGEPSG